ncbi:hypothetical protein ABVV53_14395 [Novosphingobium sp. RD2P27]|uniref:Uncharacterized protein n=1 Tax=Novosphingobium kalidii TaxID=3230299 RepID=A0ABV2D4J7_9SPHN
MLSRNNTPADGQPSRTKLDTAIVASILAMGALNLFVLIDQISPARAYAAGPCNCVISRVALA